MAGFGGKRKKIEDSLLAAPQGHLVQDGEVFNPETAVDSLLKRLENSPGMADNIAVIRYYAEHVGFKEFPGMDGPVAYGRSSDMIRYNPEVPLPSGVDRDGIFVHELTHQADRWYFGVAENQAWTSAIQKTESTILAKVETVQQWFSPGGKYFDNPFLSDIVNAVSKGIIDTPYAHRRNYWMKAGNREREVFADIAALDILIGIDTIPSECGFDDILAVFKKIISGAFLYDSI